MIPNIQVGDYVKIKFKGHRHGLTEWESTSMFSEKGLLYDMSNNFKVIVDKSYIESVKVVTRKR